MTGSSPPAHVVVIGNATLDRVWRVPVLPARGEKMRSLDYFEVGGGQAANAAVAITRLGGQARLQSPVGTDAVGVAIVEGLRTEGIDTHHIALVVGARSICSAVLVEVGGERVVVGDVDPRLHAAAPRIDPTLLDGAGAVLCDVKWPAAAEPLLRLARQRGVPTVMDIEPAAAGHHERIVPLADHAIFGQAGLKAYTGVDDPMDGLRAAFDRLGGVVGVTLGADGVRLLTAGGAHAVPAPVVAAVDTTGAGDAFHGAYALAIAEGRTPLEAARFANAVAALKCSIPGGRAGLPTRAAVERFMAGS